jgi:gluconate kinase
MPQALLDSQFATLEEPRRDERAIVIDVSQSPNRVVSRIVRFVEPRIPLPGEPPRPVRKEARPHR